MTLRIEIPGEPTAWARARLNGRMHFLPKKQAVAMDVVRLAANRVMRASPLLTGPLHVTAKFIYAWPASWSEKKRKAAGAHWKTSRPDADNLAKLVNDALNKVVWTDDAIISSTTIQKQYGVKPFTLIEIETLTPRPAGCGAHPEATAGPVVSGNLPEAEKPSLRDEMSTATQGTEGT